MNKLAQRNLIRSYIYMAALTLIITMLGYVISTVFHLGLSGTGTFLIISGIINYIAYFYSDRLIIASAHAKQIKENEIPELYKMVQNLVAQANLPMPKLYYIDDDAINAFATGRDHEHAAIVFTKGTLEKLTPNELKGVLGHELSHVKNLDIRLMAVVSVLVGLISIVADIYWRSQAVSNASSRDRSGILSYIGLVLALIAPISAMFVQLAISRRREYMADAAGATLVKTPRNLISALEKISRDQLPLVNSNYATAPLYFSNPFKSGDVIERLFSTHPPTQDRIARLSGASHQ